MGSDRYFSKYFTSISLSLKQPREVNIVILISDVRKYFGDTLMEKRKELNESRQIDWSHCQSGV